MAMTRAIKGTSYAAQICAKEGYGSFSKDWEQFLENKKALKYNVEQGLPIPEAIIKAKKEIKKTVKKTQNKQPKAHVTQNNN